MTMILDPTTDFDGRELYRLVSLYPELHFAKSAEDATLFGTQDTPAHLFADRHRRRYPCHTPEATKLSAAYFYEKQAQLPDNERRQIERNLQHSAAFFNITSELESLQKKIAESACDDVSDLPDDDFGLVYTDGKKTIRKYPLRNVQEIKAAAAWLIQHRDELDWPFSLRQRFAHRVLEKAASCGADIREHLVALEQMSGLGTCAASEAAEALRKRAYSLPKKHPYAKLSQELLKTAKLVEQSQLLPGHAEKMAELVDELDRGFNLRKHYGKGLMRPEEIFFGVTLEGLTKAAAELVGNDMTGNFYQKADLQQIPVHELADVLGEDFAQAVSTGNAWVDVEKLAELLPTLPRGDARLFDDLAAHWGIQPIATKSAAPQIMDLQERRSRVARHQPRHGSLWSRIER